LLLTEDRAVAADIYLIAEESPGTAGQDISCWVGGP